MAKSPYKKDQELLPDPITRWILQFRVVFSAITRFHTLDFTEPIGIDQETLDRILRQCQTDELR